MKIVGCILVLSGFLMKGIMSFAAYRKHYAERINIKNILFQLKQQTASENTPFSNTCLKCSRNLEAPYRDIFMEFYGDLEEKELPLKQGWETVVNEIARYADLDKEEKRILLNVCPDISFQFAFSPVDTIALALEEWDKKIENYNLKAMKNGKLSLVLNASMGVLVCLILF